MAATPENDIDTRILKYLQNDSTSEERQFLESWIKEADANKQYFEEIKSVLEQSVDLGDFDKIDVDRQWHVFKARAKISKKSKSIPTPFLKVAASIVLLLGIGYFINLVLFNEVTLIAETGKENRFVLPDESIIWLHEGSRLTYEKEFNGEERAVELVGEGYFEVKKNTTKPFVVRTANTRTEVLGTSFNLGTNPKTKTTTLVLIEGKVAFSCKDKKEVLLPGDKVIATVDGSLIKEKNKDQNFDAWKSGILRFENTSFAEMITDLEKQYKHTFVIENKELFSCALTTRFDNESLEEVLKTLEILFGIKYTVQQSKSVVVISKGGC